MTFHPPRLCSPADPVLLLSFFLLSSWYSSTSTCRRPSQLDEETLELLHYGPTSAFQHLPEPQDGRDLSLSPAASQSVGSLPAFSPHALFDAASAGPLDWRRHLPRDDDALDDWDEPLHDSLLALFFCYFNPWCWWCDEEAFRRDMAACLGSSLPSPPTRLSGYSPLLHNAILALACALSDDRRAKESSAPKSLARQAKAFVEDEGERPTLSTLQGLLLVGSFHSGNRLQGLGYIYSGIAFRMSQTRTSTSPSLLETSTIDLG